MYYIILCRAALLYLNLNLYLEKLAFRYTVRIKCAKIEIQHLVAVAVPLKQGISQLYSWRTILQSLSSTLVKQASVLQQDWT